MARRASLNVFLSLCFAILLQCTSAIELVPLRPHVSRLGKRASWSVLDLKSVETFLWAHPGESDALANFTVLFPGEGENIVSMERFDGMLKSTKCDDQGLTLTFHDDDTLAYAQKVWDWVNGADNHSFIMVAGAGDCGWNRHRQPFNVSRLSYDEAKNVAHLTARKVDWKALAHSYDLYVGRAPPSDKSLASREWRKGASLPLVTWFPFGFKVAHNNIKAGIECSKCGTQGSLEVEFIISVRNLVHIDARVTMAPRGVQANAEVKLSASGESSAFFTKTWELASIPIVAGIDIPGGILKVGPNFAVDFGLDIGPVSGEATLSTGASISIPDSSHTEINLLSPSKSTKSGWTPVVQRKPLSVDAKISIGTQIYFQPALKLSATSLHHGWEIGLESKLPYFNVKLEGLASPTGTCDDKKHILGVGGSFNTGAELSIEAKNVNDKSDPFLNYTLATIDFPLGDFCKGLGPLVHGGGGSNPPTSISRSPSATGGIGSKPSAASKCTAKSGECKSTSQCSKEGGKSTAGLCPGPADIQCCTKTKEDDSKCTSKGGICQRVDSCRTSGGTSTPGLCPGPMDIQCCTKSSPSKEDDSKCTSKGGICQRVDSCRTSGGTATPGFCPGPTDIQCCTKPKPPKEDDSKCTSKGGTCQRVESCRTSEGTSTPGLCPGPTDIQCCTKPAPKKEDDSRCTSKGGTCQRVDSCRTSGGTSTPGLCPGPMDIQCCTRPAPKKEDDSKCTSKGGTCMRVMACNSSGGSATPGLCPGEADIQCCTRRAK